LFISSIFEDTLKGYPLYGAWWNQLN